VFELLLGVLEDIAAAGPLAVVLEDLHWSDRSTLDLLALRAATSRIRGCAIVATYRSDELGPGIRCASSWPSSTAPAEPSGSSSSGSAAPTSSTS
jgi:hypothetical protein